MQCGTEVCNAEYSLLQWDSEQERKFLRLVVALWPTTIGIVVWSSSEESGRASTYLRVELSYCMQVQEVMLVHVGNFGLIVQQVACYFVALILPTNTHKQGLVNPWWVWAIWFQESVKLRDERVTKVLSIFRDMPGVLFSNSKLPHIWVIFTKRRNVISNFPMIIGRNYECLSWLQNVFDVT